MLPCFPHAHLALALLSKAVEKGCREDQESRQARVAMAVVAAGLLEDLGRDMTTKFVSMI